MKRTIIDCDCCDRKEVTDSNSFTFDLDKTKKTVKTIDICYICMVKLLSKLLNEELNSYLLDKFIKENKYG